MPASSFDFDVVTGPSTPRDERAAPSSPNPPPPVDDRPAPLPAR